eukprot:scaffold6173_cov46-Prasinocladus_malaysianus.AAC.4
MNIQLPCPTLAYLNGLWQETHDRQDQQGAATPWRSENLLRYARISPRGFPARQSEGPAPLSKHARRDEWRVHPAQLVRRISPKWHQLAGSHTQCNKTGLHGEFTFIRTVWDELTIYGAPGMPVSHRHFMGSKSANNLSHGAIDFFARQPIAKLKTASSGPELTLYQSNGSSENDKSDDSNNSQSSEAVRPP